MGEQPFRVVSGAVRLGNRDWNPPRQSREQERALYLRARDGTRVRQATELAAAYRERKAVTSFLNIRTHLSQRLGHAPHRPAAQRGIAGQRR